MFELNPKIQIREESFRDSTIYYMDDFYQDPDKIVSFINNTECFYHKQGEANSYNGIHFVDKRHNISNGMIDHVYDFLSKICNQPPLSKAFNTNIGKFFDNPFNDYKNNYWWPHLDMGYTAIVYLNHEQNCGTNLYDGLGTDDRKGIAEHSAPWRPKKSYELIKSLEPQYNRCVLFDAKKFFHGMNICNDYFFNDEYRLNHVMFFREK